MLIEKKRRILALNNEGKTVREIAELTNSSFTTISATLKEAEAEEKIVAQEKTKQEEQTKASQKYSQALKLFPEGKENIEVAIITGLRAEEVISIRNDSWRLLGSDKLAILYDQYEPYLPSFLEFNRRTRQKGISQDTIVRALEHFEELENLEKEIPRARAYLNKLDDAIRQRRNEIDFLAQKKWRLKYKLDYLKQKESELIKKF
jgi:IS30 family transposase